ncbi:MAG: pyruvate kinase alpha/beta domain-containing protein [Pelolinea sp.]|nr:pyruvate kinase alpha/beta domain-containing protein [Pelolinea sp.]
MKSEITYFEKGGEDNTAEVIEIALARFVMGDIEAVVIASTFGKTAKLAADVFAGTNAHLIIVGEVLDGEQSPSAKVCKLLSDQGHLVIWGLPMGAMSKFCRNDAPSLIADAYKRVSEGFKVVCEIVLIATSTGYLKIGQKVLSVAGTHSGADTIIIARAGGFDTFQEFQVHEILCKPYRR